MVMTIPNRLLRSDASRYQCSIAAAQEVEGGSTRSALNVGGDRVRHRQLQIARFPMADEGDGSRERTTHGSIPACSPSINRERSSLSIGNDLSDLSPATYISIHVDLHPAPLEDLLPSHFGSRPLGTAERRANFVVSSFLWHIGVGTENDAVGTRVK